MTWVSYLYFEERPLGDNFIASSHERYLRSSCKEKAFKGLFVHMLYKKFLLESLNAHTETDFTRFVGEESSTVRILILGNFEKSKHLLSGR